MKTKILILTLSLAVAPFLSTYADDGATIFKTNCGACHSVGNGKLVGPDLKGVDTRHSEEWIIKWVKASQALVKSGDKDAAKVFAENSQIVMPDQALNDADIKGILEYIKAGGDAPVTASADNTAGPKVADASVVSAQKPVAQEPEESNISKITFFIGSFNTMEYLLMFLMAMSLIVIYILGSTVKSLTERVREQKRATL